MYFYLSAVAIVKNEGSYLQEWIEYHLMIGVQHFYIFDNGSTDQTPQILASYQKTGLVTHLNWSFFPGQIPAYNFAVRMFGHSAKWMLFADPDEFVQILSNTSLTTILKEIENENDQLLIPYMFFGSSGHIRRPNGLVTANYVHRSLEPSTTVKSIVKPEAVKFVDVHVSQTHSKRSCREDGSRVAERWQLKAPTCRKIRINHYYIKSREEYTAKIMRGQVDGLQQKKIEQFDSFDFGHCDDSMRQYQTELEMRVRSGDSLGRGDMSYGRLSTLSKITYVREWMVNAHAALNKLVGPGLTLDPDKTLIDLDRNLDRAIVMFSVSEDDTAKNDLLLRAWKEAKEQLMHRMNSLILCDLDLISKKMHSEHESFIVRPDVKYDARIQAEFESTTLGKTYISFKIHAPENSKIRFEIQGTNANGETEKEVRYIVCRFNCLCGFIGICDSSLRSGKLIIHFHGADRDILISDLSLWQYH